MFKRCASQQCRVTCLCQSHVDCFSNWVGVEWTASRQRQCTKYPMSSSRVIIINREQRNQGVAQLIKFEADHARHVFGSLHSRIRIFESRWRLGKVSSTGFLMTRCARWPWNRIANWAKKAERGRLDGEQSRQVSAKTTHATDEWWRHCFRPEEAVFLSPVFTKY